MKTMFKILALALILAGSPAAAAEIDVAAEYEHFRTLSDLSLMAEAIEAGLDVMEGQQKLKMAVRHYELLCTEAARRGIITQDDLKAQRALRGAE